MRCLVPLVALAFGAIEGSSSGVAWAQAPGSVQASASAQFQEGMALFHRGEVGTACRAFERSYAMDAAPGTLFNLAVCHEAEGRLADAYRELDLLAVRAESTGRADKAQSIRARANALRPRLVRIELIHRSNRRAEVTGVSIDDVPLLSSEWSRPQYVSPQGHTVHVRFADGSEVTRPIGSLAAGSTQTVVLEEPAAAVTKIVEPPAPVSGPVVPTPSAMSPRRRVAIYATAGAGLAFVTAGAILGARAIVKRNDGLATCTDGRCSSPMTQGEANDDLHAGRVAATFSTIGFAAAGAALVSSAALFFTSGHARNGAATASSVTPAADAHGASIQLCGTF